MFKRVFLKKKHFQSCFGQKACFYPYFRFPFLVDHYWKDFSMYWRPLYRCIGHTQYWFSKILLSFTASFQFTHCGRIYRGINYSTPHWNRVKSVSYEKQFRIIPLNTCSFKLVPKHATLIMWNLNQSAISCHIGFYHKMKKQFLHPLLLY